MTTQALGDAFSIRVVANETGISADTLRAWERRYGFPRPQRRPGGSRLYSRSDVSRLRLIARAIDAGYRPGDVIALPNVDIERLTPSSESARAPREPLAPLAPAASAPALSDEATVRAIVRSLGADDITRVRSLLRSAAITRGPRAFVTDIASPLTIAIGEAWADGRIDVRHEHLAAYLLTMQLRLLGSAYEDDDSARKTVLLTTLPGERHALGLEMVAVYLGALRVQTRMLGVETPPDQIVLAARELDVDAVGLSISLASDPAQVASQVRDIARALGASTRPAELWLGGAGAETIRLPRGARRIVSWGEIDDAVGPRR